MDEFPLTTAASLMDVAIVHVITPLCVDLHIPIVAIVINYADVKCVGGGREPQAV